MKGLLSILVLLVIGLSMSTGFYRDKSNFLQKNLSFAQEKPKMSRSDISKRTKNTIDELAEIAKKHGLEISDEQKKVLFDRFLEANYEALSEHYILYDDP